MTAIFATRLYHLATSSSILWQRQLGHISFKSEDSFQKVGVNPHQNTASNSRRKPFTVFQYLPSD